MKKLLFIALFLIASQITHSADFGLSLLFTPQTVGYGQKIFISNDYLGRGYGEIDLEALSFNAGIEANVKQTFYEGGRTKWSTIGLYNVRYAREKYSYTHGKAIYGTKPTGQTNLEGWMTAPEGTVDNVTLQSINQRLLAGVRLDAGPLFYVHVAAGVTVLIPFHLKMVNGIDGKTYRVRGSKNQIIGFDVYDKNGILKGSLPYDFNLKTSHDLMFTAAVRLGFSAFFGEFEVTTSGNHTVLNGTVGIDLIPFFGVKNDK